MIFDFNPWKLDIDVEATKKFYIETDYALDKDVNLEFIDSLTKEQRAFFDSLGIDLMNIEVDKEIYDIPEDDEISEQKIYRLAVNFLMKGEILTLPQFQKDLYSDEETFGVTFPNTITVISSKEDDYVKIYDNGIGAGIVFKHPYFYYDIEQFKKWDCGFVLGSALIMHEL